MSGSRTRFRLVRRALLSLLPCLLMVLSALASPAVTASIAGEVDPSFQEAPLIGLVGSVKRVVVQPDGKMLIGGYFTTVNSVRRDGIARLNADGTLDTAFTASTNEGERVSAVALQADGKVVIGGEFTTVNGIRRDGIARLNADGSLDAAFAPDLGHYPPVSVLVVQPDGKILIGNDFSGRLVRLNPDGTSDPTFAAPGGLSPVAAVALQADGKIMIGTSFGVLARLNADGSQDTTFAESHSVYNLSGIIVQPDGKIVVSMVMQDDSSGGIVRLNADGSQDTTFTSPGSVNAGVHAVALQADGKIVMGGDFTTVSGVTRNHIARLSVDGSLDTTFAPTGGPDSTVSAVAMHADGKIVIGGEFTIVNNTKRTFITRLHADSSLDTTFLASSNSWTGVNAIVVQPDGKLIIGGTFRIATETGQRYLNIARLNADGTLDSTFNPPGGASERVVAVALQPDGKIVIGGMFTIVNGVSRNHIARLNADGTLDSTFAYNGGANLNVLAVALQADGKVVIGGGFTVVNGVSRNRIARLNGDGTLDSTFTASSNMAGGVSAVAVQADGKIVIGGRFDAIDERLYLGLARLNVDGTFDSTFQDHLGDALTAVALQPDGKIVVGIETYHGINRLNADGSADPSFASSVILWDIYDLALQADGKIVIGGNFTTVNGVSRSSIARLNANGSLDPFFAPDVGVHQVAPYILDDRGVRAIAVQADGKIIMGGGFFTVNGVARASLARLVPLNDLHQTYIPQTTR